ncbi:MAG: FG-GAP repeat domain-containing protein [Pyrinomonadaceae bacterium]
MFLEESDNRARKVVHAFFAFFSIIVIFCGAAQAIPQNVVDFDGDARTDYSITRRVVNNIVWYNYDGFSQQPAGVTAYEFGLAQFDTLIPEDFDGDNKSDIAIWRPNTGGESGFWVFRSLDSTITFDPFGLPNDNPAVVADYDGDGKADSAVYRCPTGSTAGPCVFYYNSSITGALNGIQWGFGTATTISPYIGDFDGDAKADVCIQREDPANPGKGQFVMRRSGDGGVEFIDWGFDTDLPVAGDYDGDGKTDFCVRRTTNSQRFYYVLTRTGGFIAQQWGLAGDVSVPGDYDGDGKTDFAVWRGSPTQGQSIFYALLSQTGTLKAVQWGLCPVSACDTPSAAWMLN